MSGIVIAIFTGLLNPYSNYARFLKEECKSITNPKWPPLSSEIYIPLAAVEMGGTSLAEADELTKFLLYSSPEQILERKAEIKFDDLLKQHSDGLKFVLVEGAPGIGKSTLAKEICQRWATNPTVDNHLKQFSLVFLVQLRDETAQRATVLFDLLPKDAKTNMKELELQINRTYGRDVLWILDGFDELPYDQRQKDSLYRRLIEGKILKLSIVLVTSRPTASGPLVQFVERIKNRAKRVEIVGFNSSRIKEYAEEYFKHYKHDRLPSFINYYNSTPVIKKLMYIPLNAAIVCLVYNESYTKQVQFPKTMTELYDAFTKLLILRHLLDKNEVVEDFEMPPRLMCEEDIRSTLPMTAQKEFWNLVKIAYDGVIIPQYIFNKLDNVKDNLGLMNNVSGLVSTGTRYTSSFLHTTLQEYLAALYIANKPNELTKQTFSNINLQRNSNLEVVLVFYAGITSKLQQELDNHTLTTLLESRFLECTVVARCVYESPELVSTFISSSRCQGYVSSTRALDYYIVGYLISHYNISLNVDIKFGDSFEFIAEGIESSSDSDEPCGQLTDIRIIFKLNSNEDRKMLFKLPKVVVKGLTLLVGKNEVDETYIINITKSFPILYHLHHGSRQPVSCAKVCIHLKTLKYLKKLVIKLNGTYEELSLFVRLIEPGRPIRQLRLSLVYNVCPPLYMLFYPSSLETLELTCYPAVDTNHCEAKFNKNLISQNIHLKNLVINGKCPRLETIFSLLNNTNITYNRD